MKRTLVSVTLVLALANPALAQTRPATPEPLTKVEGLPTVFLTDQRGLEHKGRLLRVAPEEVVMLVGEQERTFKRDEIVLIEKRGDSLVNGALIGAAVGAVGGLFIAGIADCPDGSSGGCAGSRITGFFISIGLYTAVGAGIDAAISGRTVMYRAHKVTVQAAPQKLQVAFNVRW